MDDGYLRLVTAFTGNMRYEGGGMEIVELAFLVLQLQLQLVIIMKCIPDG